MFVGVDLGGTKIAYAVIDHKQGRVLARHVAATSSADGSDAVLIRMAEDIRHVVARAGVTLADIYGIGCGVPGVYDDATGHTLFLPNLMGTWHQVPVGPVLTASLGVPVWLINDARAFVLAEATYGAGRGQQNVVGFTIGTGIGGGVVINQRLYMGINGTAGEFGHQTLALDGPQCGCGNYGCLEAFASGTAMVAQAKTLIEAGQAPDLAHQVASGLHLTPSLMANCRDIAVHKMLVQVYQYLGAGVANVVSLFSPNVVVLGGSVSQLGAPLCDAVRQVVIQRCRATPVERIPIVTAELGGDAGVLGAAVWAVHRSGAEIAHTLT
ncbi:MAG: ROK family protein [Roseiflexaceae bacterium]